MPRQTHTPTERDSWGFGSAVIKSAPLGHSRRVVFFRGSKASGLGVRVSGLGSYRVTIILGNDELLRKLVPAPFWKGDGCLFAATLCELRFVVKLRDLVAEVIIASFVIPLQKFSKISAVKRHRVVDVNPNDENVSV